MKKQNTKHEKGSLLIIYAAAKTLSPKNCEGKLDWNFMHEQLQENVYACAL